LPTQKPVDDEAFHACYYLSYRNEAIRKRLQKMYTRFRNELIDDIRACVEAGIIPETDPERTADLLVVLEEGLNVCEIMREDDRQSEEFRRYVKEGVLKLLRNGEAGVSKT